MLETCFGSTVTGADTTEGAVLVAAGTETSARTTADASTDVPAVRC